MKAILTSFLITAALVFTFTTFTISQTKEDKSSEAESSLQEELDSMNKKFMEKADKDKIEVYEKGIQEVRESGILENALNVGDKAIGFELQNPTGEKVTLEEYLKEGPVILTWYRGGWCPYCNMTLHKLQEYLPQYKELGANLIALTPETPDKSLTTQEKHALQFEVLTDTDNGVAKQYGIVFKLNPEVSQYYKERFSLEEYNDTDSDELPLAAAYIIGQDGIIKYAFLDADYKKRAEPSVLLEELKKLD